jgi:2-keto-4-pentenoate hydratase/2-oxohepta-3-ene-1,7-dioic acid hydratase in catechol pathway
MRLVSYEASGAWHPGAIYDDGVYSLARLLAASGLDQGPGADRSVLSFLDAYGGDLSQIADTLERTARSSDGVQIGRLADVRLGPPITNPAKVLCVGLNYQDHVAETGRKLPTHPDVFSKFATTLIGPQDEIRCSDVTSQLDYEGELAIVIGRRCRNVDEVDALDHVAGLMVLNDITARDLQYNGTQFLPGKAVDGSTPCGPAIVTLDEVDDPQALDIATRVNGTEVQRSNTKHMIFPLARIITYISRFLELSPGDIISTGTPDGVGSKRQPPLWLMPNDVVEVEVEGVGLLRNTIR